MRSAAFVACLAAASAGTAGAAQDFQVGARAKAMGGSYTAFGDDPVSVWVNPAGTAAQASQLTVTYQSFVQYEFDDFSDTLPTTAEGDAEQGLLDPPITPSFAGVVVQMGDADLEMAASLAYVRPFQIKYVYVYDDPDPALDDLLTQTDQQFSRIRAAFAVSVRLSEGAAFNRLAVGAGADFVYTKYKEIDQNPNPARDTQIYEDSESSAGYGLGMLLTAYEGDTFRADLGAAYNSRIDFHFDLDPNIYPVWDWPPLASAGMAFYVGQGYPLRLTLDTQWIGWKDSVGEPDPSQESFEDTLSFSAGTEYRFRLGETKRIYARMGFKSYDTPWKDESELPAVGLSQLKIDTKGDRVSILTAGLGFYWSRRNAEGETRLSGLDLAVELFGETGFLMGVGFNYQFD
jgi:hypothetical protein